MENEFVPFELAVKLKELGFDELCLGWFTTLGNLVIKENVKNSHVDKTNTAAPLWQQAFDWFRETKNCFAIVDFYRANGNPNKLYFYTIDVFETGRETDDKFENYEEARTACLEKLIELVINPINN